MGRRNMGIKYAFVILIVGFALSVNAAREFSAVFDSVDGARGTISNGALHISNCNIPTEKQYINAIIKLKYPRDYCSGQMDIFYKYYDFSSGQYSDEDLLCIIGSDESCKARLNIFFGGKGEGSETADEWIKLRAVCRSSEEEFNYSIPMEIAHSPIDFEVDVLAKINGAESSLADAKSLLEECSCCDSAMLNDISDAVDELGRNLSRCDFTGLANNAINIKKKADSIRNEIEQTVCGEQAVAIEEEQNGSVAGEIVNEAVGTAAGPEGKAEEEKGEAAVCPFLLILLSALALLSLAKAIAIR